MYYTNPLDANAGRPEWQNCPCCVGNISRTVLMLPTWMYSKGENAIFVNLFAGSKITVEGVAGTDVHLVQETDYPWKGAVGITVTPAKSARFAINVRVPNRDVSTLYRGAAAANGITSIKVNGAAVPAPVKNGYATLDRTWKAGDTIALELPMVPNYVHASEKITATTNKVALRYGPLVYNIEHVDQDITQAIDAKAPLTAEFRKDLLGGVTVIHGKFANGTPLLAIPNFARFNRVDPNPVPAIPSPPASEPGQPPARPAPLPPSSIVWMHEH